MYPPRLASDFEKVPMMTSTLSSSPKWLAVPRPPSPMTPRPWASSTMTRAPYFDASSQISGSFAMSPPMENTPSVTMRQPADSGTARSLASRSSMFEWR